MKLTYNVFRGACLAGGLVLLSLVVQAQSDDAPLVPTGAQMMEELTRLTMVPLAEEPLTFEGHLAFSLTQSGHSSVGEMRWGNHGQRIMWTDDLYKQGWHTVLLAPDQPLATLKLENAEGHFMTPDMMKMARYWTEEGLPLAPKHPLKLNRKVAPDTLLGMACMRHDVKVGQERAFMWVAAGTTQVEPEALQGLREAWFHWLNSRTASEVLRGLILPEGVPLKVEWGVAEKGEPLPHSMSTLTLNASSDHSLNAPEIWMQVPGRDINEVARELRETQEAAGDGE